MAKKNVNMEDYDRWGTPPNAVKVTSKNTPEQQKLIEELKAKEAKKKAAKKAGKK